MNQCHFRPRFATEGYRACLCAPEDGNIVSAGASVLQRWGEGRPGGESSRLPLPAGPRDNETPIMDPLASAIDAFVELAGCFEVFRFQEIRDREANPVTSLAPGETVPLNGNQRRHIAAKSAELALVESAKPLALALAKRGLLTESEGVHRLRFLLEPFALALDREPFGTTWASIKPRLQAVADSIRAVPSNLEESRELCRRIAAGNDPHAPTESPGPSPPPPPVLWGRDPIGAFKCLRDLLCGALSVVSDAYRLALTAAPDDAIGDVCRDLFGELDGAIVQAQGYWFRSPISRYLERPEGPVRLDGEEGIGPVIGSCYHDLALGVAVGLWGAMTAGMSARDYARAMRYNTAAGDQVRQRLGSLATRVRCECRQGIVRLAKQEHVEAPRIETERSEGDQCATGDVAAEAIPGRPAPADAGPTNDQADPSAEVAAAQVVAKGRDGLSSQSLSILKKLRDLLAFDESSRQSGKVIADAMRVRTGYISRHAKPLKQSGLANSRDAAGGGYWLTEKGRDRAADLS